MHPVVHTIVVVTLAYLFGRMVIGPLVAHYDLTKIKSWLLIGILAFIFGGCMIGLGVGAILTHFGI